MVVGAAISSVRGIMVERIGVGASGVACALHALLQWLAHVCTSQHARVWLVLALMQRC